MSGPKSVANHCFPFLLYLRSIVRVHVTVQKPCHLFSRSCSWKWPRDTLTIEPNTWINYMRKAWWYGKLLFSCKKGNKDNRPITLSFSLFSIFIVNMRVMAFILRSQSDNHSHVGWNSAPPPKFVCWCPNLQFIRMTIYGDRIFTEVVSQNSILTGVLIRRGTCNIHSCTEERPHEDTGRRGP